MLILASGTAISLIKSNISFSDGERSLSINQVQEISNDTDYAIKQLEKKVHHLENDIKWLKTVYEGTDVVPVLESLDETIRNEIEPTLNEAEKASDRLKNAVEGN